MEIDLNISNMQIKSFNLQNIKPNISAVQSPNRNKSRSMSSSTKLKPVDVSSRLLNWIQFLISNTWLHNSNC